MTIRPFDYDAYWRDRGRDGWRTRGLHWRCHASRMDGNAYSDDPARRDRNSELAPGRSATGSAKPARAIRQTPLTPDDAVSWLRAQWEPIKGQVGEVDGITEETHLGTALYDVCWGFWLHATIYLHLAVVGTAERCHP